MNLDQLEVDFFNKLVKVANPRTIYKFELRLVDPNTFLCQNQKSSHTLRGWIRGWRQCIRSIPHRKNIREFFTVYLKNEFLRKKRKETVPATDVIYIMFNNDNMSKRFAQTTAFRSYQCSNFLSLLL